jgi:hypothetical protein
MSQDKLNGTFHFLKTYNLLYNQAEVIISMHLIKNPKSLQANYKTQKSD